MFRKLLRQVPEAIFSLLSVQLDTGEGEIIEKGAIHLWHIFVQYVFRKKNKLKSNQTKTGSKVSILETYN